MIHALILCCITVATKNPLPSIHHCKTTHVLWFCGRATYMQHGQYRHRAITTDDTERQRSVVWWYYCQELSRPVWLSRIVKTCVNCQELSRHQYTSHQATTQHCIGDWWLGLCLTILVDKYGCKDMKDWPTSKTRHQRDQRKRDNHRADRSCFLPLWFLICHPTIFDGNGIKWCLMNKVLTCVSTFDDVSIFDGSNNINPMGKSQVLELS